MTRPIIVSENPPLIIHSYSPDTAAGIDLQSVEIMDGRIAVDLHRADAGKRAALYAVFASVGMSNDEIGQTTDRSPLTIKSHMQNLFDRVGLNGRANIAQWLFSSGVFTVETPATAPYISPREQQVMNLLTDGFQNKEIGERLHISGNTVKTHLQRIADKVGYADREALALASFVFQNPEAEEPAA